MCFGSEFLKMCVVEVEFVAEIGVLWKLVL